MTLTDEFGGKCPGGPRNGASTPSPSSASAGANAGSGSKPGLDDVVARVVLQRAPRCAYTSGSPLRLHAILSSEFNEVLSGLLLRLRGSLRATWHRAEDAEYNTASCAFLGDSSSGSSGPLSQSLSLSLQSTGVTAGEAVCFSGHAPEEAGRWRLCVAYVPPADSVHVAAGAAIVLDYWSDLILISPSPTDADAVPRAEAGGAEKGGERARSNSVFAPPMPMLANYRRLALPCMQQHGIVLREEYGSCMGGHIYDSSVVLVTYWDRIWEAAALSKREEQASRAGEADDIAAPAGVCIELGAGCGLVGIFLAQHGAGVHRYNRVLLTDKACMRQMVDMNIAANSNVNSSSDNEGTSDERVARAEFAALEWMDGKQVSALLHHRDLASQPLRLIVAADVLYGEEVSGAFLHVLRKLLQVYKERCKGSAARSADGHALQDIMPSVIVAQKVRDDAPLDVSALPDFHATLLLEVHQVRVWSLQCRE